MKGKRLILILSLIVSLTTCGKKASPIPKSISPTYVISDLKGDVKDGILFLSFSIPKDRSSQIELDGFKIIREEKKEGRKIGEKERDLKIKSSEFVTRYKDRIYFFDEELIPNLTYVYRVYPYTKDGLNIGPSNPFSITWKKPPGTVKGVEIRNVGGIIEIKWEKEEGYFYNVYRYDKGSYSFFPLNEKPIDLSFYRDSTIKKEGTYVYEVRKLRKEENLILEGEGKRIEIVYKPDKFVLPPFNVIAEKKEDAINISWQIEKKDVIKAFRIYRSAQNKLERIGEVTAEHTIFVDREYPKGRYVYYIVRSVSYGGDESEDSNYAIVHIGEE
ncbi:MAG: hypothetical protein N2513_01215 [Deltaproteobacteria bacterium]|nr:hypothetical protein [Deltaproteobacteria bacterium]